MARNRDDQRKAADPDKRAAADYYKLNLRAVEALVTADVSNSPKVDEAELRKYRSGPKLRLSEAVKALFIKAWFAGAVCFFFLWGLGTYLRHPMDQLIVLGFALGAVTDLLTNNVFRFYARTPGANDRFMMFPQKAFYTLPLNILYGYGLLFCVVTTYNAVNTAMLALRGGGTDVPLGVGPIGFGLFVTAWDTLWIRVKVTAQSILNNARRKVAEKGE